LHLLETYALSTASKIGKPYILKKYFPIDAEKYITIQNSSGMPGKCYDFFEEVVKFLKPLLDSNNYKIVQIGDEKDRKISEALDLTGKTNINQTAYVISRSSLHLGNDSFAVHMASAFDIPTVALYGITTPEIAGPYWSNKKINLYSNKFKPSFNPNESPKTVNNIKIEEVVEACEKLLFEKKSINITTNYIGSRYNDRIIESIPNQVINKEFFKDTILNLRFDYLDDVSDLSSTFYNLSQRKCVIVTDKTINIENLENVKQNIEIVIYDVSKNVDISFIKKLEKFGINYVCTVDKSSVNEDVIETRKFELMDFCNINLYFSTPENLPLEIKNETLFKSNRIILSNGKIYNSRSAQLSDIPIVAPNASIKYSDIKDKKEFLKDIDYCFLYTEN
jgi:hypothetical protein